MADGLDTQSATLATVSAGVKIATDDCGAAGHTQVVKISVGGEADATVATTFPISHAALTELASAIDTEVQVDVVGALPAGTNAIGKLAANSGVDIGDVDVTSIAAGDNNIGNVDIVTVPADPFGANADAASATGSISAKLRFIAATGIPITAVPAVTTATLANVSASASNVTLISSNASRKGAMIANDSASAVYVKFGATASATSFTVKIAAYGYYEFPAPCYTGIVDGIWDTATGSARTTEV